MNAVCKYSGITKTQAVKYEYKEDVQLYPMVACTNNHGLHSLQIFNRKGRERMQHCWSNDHVRPLSSEDSSGNYNNKIQDYPQSRGI